MKRPASAQRLVALLLGALLVASALGLVTSQHRARGLFIDLEHLTRESRELDADRERLRIELGRASQPAVVESTARRMGLTPAAAPRTVVVHGPAPRPSDAAAPAVAAPQPRSPSEPVERGDPNATAVALSGAAGSAATVAPAGHAVALRAAPAPAAVGGSR